MQTGAPGITSPRSLAVTRLPAPLSSGESLSCSSTGSDGDGWLYLPAVDEWDGLCVDYDPPWPLHLLLTPQVACRCCHSSEASLSASRVVGGGGSRGRGRASQLLRGENIVMR